MSKLLFCVEISEVVISVSFINFGPDYCVAGLLTVKVMLLSILYISVAFGVIQHILFCSVVFALLLYEEHTCLYFGGLSKHYPGNTKTIVTNHYGKS